MMDFFANIEFVKSHWHEAEFRRGDKYHPGIAGGRIYAKNPAFEGMEWILSGNVNWPFERSNLLTEEMAWAEAAEFTRKKLEEIRLIELEDEFIKMWRSTGEPKDLGWQACDRILARQCTALATARRGMK